ncbi:hypothetical protein D6D01_06516 [Aureobasidium pullulans]|uniref:Uncharacterized protein n=1 Tax=Aureobasidium pullulans TaxID=5580 RepID=A0A4V4JUI0_AURPU|nr:hypothetical protein D6D01_06516 [Aureobasidium pullulans]
MDDSAFMLLQLQQNVQFLRTHDARLLTCLTYDKNNEPYWSYAIVTYDKYGNVEDYHDPHGGLAEWSRDPLEILKKLHWKVAGFVANRLIHDCRPRLRTLTQQRADEAPIKSNPSSDESNEQTFTDAEPYQPQKLGPAHFPQPSPMLGSETWSSNSVMSRAKQAKNQRNADIKSHQPQKLGPSHFPQPVPSLGSETWPPPNLHPHAKLSRSANKQQEHAFDTDGPSIQQQIQATTQRGQSVRSAVNQSYDSLGDGEMSMYSQARATAQRDKFRSTKSKLHREELGLNSSALQHAEESQISFANTASIPHLGADQQQQSRARQYVLEDNAAHREIVRHSEALEAEALSPWVRNNYNDPLASTVNTKNQSILPEPLTSHPPRGQPISIMIDRETFNMQQTDPVEFAHRVNLASLAMAGQAHSDREPIARSKYEGQKYLNDESRQVISDIEKHDDFDSFFNAFSQAREADRRTASQTPLIHFPGSPESDKTVTPFHTFMNKGSILRRRRSTPTRFDQEITDPVPPAAPSPPSTSQYTSRGPSYPPYPPNLFTSRSEAAIPRNTSASSEAIRRNFSASNETMRRSTPTDNDEMPLEARRLSQIQQPHEGEPIHVQIQQDRDVFRRTGQIFRVVGRKVSETLSGRRLSSVP